MQRLQQCLNLSSSRRLLLSVFSRSVALRVGDKLPAVELVEGPARRKLNTHDLFAGKRSIMFGVPGAFTPTCSQVSLPSYVREYDQLRSKGVAEVFCLSVNDPFVMQAWAEVHNAVGKVRMLSDTQGIFVLAADLALDMTYMLGGIRSKRFAMLIDDGIVTQLFVESDPSNATCTVAEWLLKTL